MESLHGGTLLGARGTGFVMFWDWESYGKIYRRIDDAQPDLGLLVWYRFVSVHYR